MGRITQLSEYNAHTAKRGPGGTTLFIEDVCGKNILIDCGAGFTGNEARDLYGYNKDHLRGMRIDLAICSHLHFDHAGKFPELFSRYADDGIVIPEDTEVLMSEPTFYGLQISFSDSVGIWEKEIKRAQRDGREVARPPYTRGDVENFFKRVGVIGAPSEWTFTDFPGWRFWFDRSGHEPGAMSTFISPPEGANIIHTGDIKEATENPEEDQPIVRGASWSNPLLNEFWEESAKKGLVLITEATNGSKKVPNFRTQAVRMVERQFEAERAGAYATLFPSFAFNRSANNAMWLLRVSDELGHPLRVHVDGMARKTFKHYMRLAENSSWASEYDKAAYAVMNQYVEEGRIIFFGETEHDQDGRGHEAKQRSDMHREAVAKGTDPCGCSFSPIIAPSANMDKGFAVVHGQRIAPNRNSIISMTGHIFENTPTEEMVRSRVHNLRKGWTLKLGGQDVPVA